MAIESRKKAIPHNINAKAQNKHLNPQNSKTDSYKLEDGNGLIPSLKELVHVQEEAILPHFQVLQLSFSVAITTQGKHRDIPISMILMFLMSTPTSLL